MENQMVNYSGSNQLTSKKVWSNPELKVLSKDIVQSGGNYTIVEIEIGTIVQVGTLPS